MLLDENNDLTAITGTQRFVCQIEGCKRRASWLTASADDGKPTKMCGYHVFYGGSKWGEERKGEIVHLGNVVRNFALKTQREGTNVPKLDPRGRLPSDDCERYLLGVKHTTGTARRLMGRVRALRSLFDGPD